MLDPFAAHEMNVFSKIVDAGSFAAAAGEVGMTPSAVSKLVSRLEARLGVRLLTRTTRRLALTGEGETYLDAARRIVADIEAAEAELTASAREPSGLLKINTGVVLGRHVVMPMMPDFMERYPKISVELNIADRQVDVIGEQVDIAIRTGPLVASPLIARKIGDTMRVICVSPTYLERYGRPESPADLRDHNCMAAGGFPELLRWPFLTPEGVNVIEVNGGFTSDSLDVIVDMVLAGKGIGRMSRIIVAQHLDSGALVELFKDSHRRDPLAVHALMPPGGNRSLKVRAFLDYMIGHPLVRARF
ncbi:LysR family transcriptional regulator [Agrobacterium sp. ES01]|uniref:LysR family transcriptional regulator n=1 Tax=Agrobacterium sp. ES01 TaxID=3420714 RepID=UPI003D145A9A